MGKKAALLVSALSAGFYGKYRNPGEEFTLNSVKHFSANWMLPENFEAKKNDEGEFELVDAAEAVLDDLDEDLDDDDLDDEEEEDQDEDGDADDDEGDDDTLESFRQFKEEYANGDIVVKGEDALLGAFKDFEGDVAAWNALTQKNRQEKTLAKVRELLEKAGAAE